MLENIKLSFKGIRSHKMRSALTMLGIVIGIASIIIIVSLISGTSEQLKTAMIDSGDSTITIALYNKENPWTPMDPSFNTLPDGVVSPDSDTIQEIKSLDDVENATAVYSSEYNIKVSHNGIENSSCVVMGVEKEYFSLKNYVLTSGRYFIDRDYDNRNNVAVISSGVASSMFTNEDAVGQTIAIGDEIFTVVGVVQNVIDESEINNITDYYLKVAMQNNDFVIVPSVSWVNFGGFDLYSNLVVKIKDVDDTVKVGGEAANILNMNITNNGYEYRSSSMQEDADYLENITQFVSILLIGIASISLLVGGIGVMNIMLVSVTERTREIGLKKALGAKKRVILGQFLTESVVLTGLGGVLGVLIGIGISYLVSLVLSMPASISIPAVAIAVGFSMGVGIIFGIMPSIKAANLNPIDALRYE